MIHRGIGLIACQL